LLDGIPCKYEYQIASWCMEITLPADTEMVDQPGNRILVCMVGTRLMATTSNASQGGSKRRKPLKMLSPVTVEPPRVIKELSPPPVDDNAATSEGAAPPTLQLRQQEEEDQEPRENERQLARNEAPSHGGEEQEGMDWMVHAHPEPPPPPPHQGPLPEPVSPPACIIPEVAVASASVSAMTTSMDPEQAAAEAAALQALACREQEKRIMMETLSRPDDTGLYADINIGTAVHPTSCFPGMTAAEDTLEYSWSPTSSVAGEGGGKEDEEGRLVCALVDSLIDDAMN
jgi:hypothetical protein